MPSHTINALREAIRLTEHNTGLVLNFAMNYGSRREMTDCVKQIALQVKSGNYRQRTLHLNSLTDICLLEICLIRIC